MSKSDKENGCNFLSIILHPFVNWQGQPLTCWVYFPLNFHYWLVPGLVVGWNCFQKLVRNTQKTGKKNLQKVYLLDTNPALLKGQIPYAWYNQLQSRMAGYPRLVNKLAKDGSQKVCVVPFSKEPARNINIFQLIWMEMEVHNTSNKGHNDCKAIFF